MRSHNFTYVNKNLALKLHENVESMVYTAKKSFLFVILARFHQERIISLVLTPSIPLQLSLPNLITIVKSSLFNCAVPLQSLIDTAYYGHVL